jgi:FkbM family methyltransferase
MCIPTKNISIADEIFSYLKFLKFQISVLIHARRVYRNYFNVVNMARKYQYPIQAILRSGEQVTLKSWNEVYVPISLHDHQGYRYDFQDDLVTISSIVGVADNNVKVQLHGGVTNGDAISIFRGDAYDRLPVKGCTVIDIGANIGDSSIYFALRGADKVIALEPFPKNYELAKKNIQMNNCSSRICIAMAACGTSTGYITFDANKSGGNSSLVRTENGTTIPMLTLEDILNKNDIRTEDSLLKMDCEGCEYESILSATSDTLRRFSHIIIEYHYGYKNLKTKLETIGFDVDAKRPTKNYHNMHVGYIYARRNL